MSYCPTCKEWIYESGRHSCPPEWEVWREDDDREDAKVVRARSAEAAVEARAKDWDSDDHTLLLHEDATVVFKVAAFGSDRVRLFEVRGRMVPEYTVEEVEPEEEKPDSAQQGG